MSAIPRLAVWSGPRNLSTALLRSWENRSDTEVLDEPLYAHYLAATGLDHPRRDEILNAGPVEASDAIGRCLAAPVDAAFSYQKHMAHHLLPDMDRAWLDEFGHALLLRHPARVLASYMKKRAQVTVDDLGLPQQTELASRFGSGMLVIDSDDFLQSPRLYLEALCRHAGVRFDESMLAWPAGPRPSDGVWASHWYDAVWASTGFGPPPASSPPVLPDHLQPVLAEALEHYESLRALSLRL